MSALVALLKLSLFVVLSCGAPAPSTTVLSATEIPTASFDPAFALTTQFVGAPECSSQRLTQLVSPGYQIWMNEPVPALHNTVTDCYPSQFLRNYTSISFASQVPPMSPLVCPQLWTTVMSVSQYAACCPINYSLAHPSSIDADRPGYGGTCYSNFNLGQVVTITAYDSLSVTGTFPWTASTAGAQAYAHVIDGYVNTQSNSIPTETGSPSGTSTPGSSGNASPSGRSRVSSGAIAGAIVGSIAGLSALGLLAFFAIKATRSRRDVQELPRRPSELDTPPPGPPHYEVGNEKSNWSSSTPHEVPGVTTYRYELASNERKGNGTTPEKF